MKDWQLSSIGRLYEFSAAHHLPNVDDGHKCKNLHGHNYKVELEIRGEIAPLDGFCNNMDFAKIDDYMKPLLAKLDHNNLNTFIENPTTELVAQWILDNFNPAILFSVKVWESEPCRSIQDHLLVDDGRSWAKVVNRDGYFQKEHRE